MGDRLFNTLLVFTASWVLAWPGAAAPRADDQSGSRIVREVRHELLMLPYFRVLCARESVQKEPGGPIVMHFLQDFSSISIVPIFKQHP